MPLVQGEVVVFTDVRQSIEPRAIRLLVENFADASVGCVRRELMLGDPEGGESSRGMGLYWRVEKKVRELESLSGSTIGATGALYAARKTLLVELPADLILDDVYLPMSVIRQGFRVIFDPRARAWDQADLGSGREFWRKVRTLSGNYQLVEAAPWLVSKENPARWDFVSHKLPPARGAIRLGRPPDEFGMARRSLLSELPGRTDRLLHTQFACRHSRPARCCWSPGGRRRSLLFCSTRRRWWHFAISLSDEKTAWGR